LFKPAFIFLYSTDDANVRNNNKKQLDIIYAKKHRFLQELIAAFSIGLWIIKDNALNFNQSYHCNLKNGYEANIGYDLKNVCSNGRFSSVSFNNKEIQHALDYLNTNMNLEEYLKSKDRPFKISKIKFNSYIEELSSYKERIIINRISAIKY